MASEIEGQENKIYNFRKYDFTIFFLPRLFFEFRRHGENIYELHGIC